MYDAYNYYSWHLPLVMSLLRWCNARIRHALRGGEGGGGGGGGAGGWGGGEGVGRGGGGGGGEAGYSVAQKSPWLL